MKKLIRCALPVALILALLVPLSLGSCQPIQGLRYSDNADNTAGQIEEAFAPFDPQVQERIRSIPIEKEWTINTALAQTVDYVDYQDVRILVNSDWDNIYCESPSWESVYKKRGVDSNDPVFPNEFKTRLLVHEYLHILQAESDIDITSFCAEVLVWYVDLAWGEPTPDGYFPQANYVKYTLWWNIYSESGQEYYADTASGVEEFAYIGCSIVDGYGHQIPENILTYYNGILDTNPSE